MVWRGSNSLGGLGEGSYSSLLLISLQNFKNSQTSFAMLQIINSSCSWSTSSGVGRSRYSICRIREKQFYQSWCHSLYCVSRSPSSENTSSGSHDASEMGWVAFPFHVILVSSPSSPVPDDVFDFVNFFAFY